MAIIYNARSNSNERNMSEIDWKNESKMFNQIAGYYDRYRPGYLQDIVEAIIKIKQFMRFE